MFGSKKKSGYLAPLVITGITAGVLYKAYKAIFVESNELNSLENKTEKPLPRTVNEQPKDVDDLVNDRETDEPLPSK